MRVAIEAWAPEYGSALSSANDVTPTSGKVDVNWAHSLGS